ncbi:MAG: hypothetical protein ACXABY_25530 [Candidatus Thorarchaeota archaeon]|jgi:tRNA pseudouridine-54 N-methylase
MMEQVAHLTFILYLPEVSGAGKFHFKDLPGSGKRIDVLCRSLAACFDWAPSTIDPTNLEVIALVGSSTGLRIRNPGKDKPRGEISWASALKDALSGDPPKFIAIDNLSLKDIVEEIQTDSDTHLWVLDETGASVGQETLVDFNAQNIFIIGDYKGFDGEALKVFDDHSIYRLSLGSTSYLTSHCVAAIISMYEEMINDGRRYIR